VRRGVPDARAAEDPRIWSAAPPITRKRSHVLARVMLLFVVQGGRARDFAGQFRFDDQGAVGQSVDERRESVELIEEEQHGKRARYSGRV
jgi:hypothetical protein